MIFLENLTQRKQNRAEKLILNKASINIHKHGIPIKVKKNISYSECFADQPFHLLQEQYEKLYTHSHMYASTRQIFILASKQIIFTEYIAQ